MTRTSLQTINRV